MTTPNLPATVERQLPQVPEVPWHAIRAEDLTPDMVSQALIDLTIRLDAGTKVLRLKIEEYDDAKEEYDFAFAHALLDSEQSSEKKREADAKTSCKELYHKQRLAKTVLDVTKERLKTLHILIEAGRTLSASSRLGYEMGQQPGR